MKIGHFFFSGESWFDKFWRFLAPLGDLFIRIWLAEVFFRSGLTKITTWESTVMLFQHEYTIPILSPHVAAVIGTGAELILPVLLVLGLFGRWPAFLLSIFNLVALFSYPFLWTEAGRVGFDLHIYWALLLLMLLVHGSGKLNLDYLIAKFSMKEKASY